MPTLITTVASGASPRLSRSRARADASGRKNVVSTPLDSTRIGAVIPYFGAETSCFE